MSYIDTVRKNPVNKAIIEIAERKDDITCDDLLAAIFDGLLAAESHTISQGGPTETYSRLKLHLGAMDKTVPCKKRLNDYKQLLERETADALRKYGQK